MSVFLVAMPTTVSSPSPTVFLHPQFLLRLSPTVLSIVLTFVFPLLLLLCFISSTSAAEHVPFVATQYGTIRGQLQHVVDHVDGQPVTMASFVGVPYARPPLGELRFEPDQLSEDCLYVNIFGPPQKPAATDDDQRSNVLLPVLVYIHGGGFQAGSMRQYKPEAVAKFVRRGLLFVTLQYRLAMLGFAATGADSFAGNYGLWDQAMALRFLHDNVRNFGGDPSRVTLWGFSAGAASVAHLAMSPHTHGLFQNAIEQSGANFVEWAASELVLGETARWAKAVGCAEDEQIGGHEKADILKKCLRQKTPQELMDGITKIGRGRPEVNFFQFHPRYEPNFFPADAITLIQSSPPKRSLMGVTLHEALTFTLFTQDPTLMSMQIPRAEWTSFGRAQLEEFVAQKIAPQKYFGDTAPAVQQRILQFYTADENGQKNGSESGGKWLAKYSEIITDTMFLVPMLLEARQKLAAGWPIYLYQIEHINTGYPDDIPVRGAFHAMELEPLFDITFLYKVKGLQTTDAFNMNCTPRTDSLPNWHPIDEQSPLRYALMSSDGTQMGRALAPKKFDFWRQLSAEFTFDIIRGIQRDDTMLLHSKCEL